MKVKSDIEELMDKYSAARKTLQPIKDKLRDSAEKLPPLPAGWEYDYKTQTLYDERGIPTEFLITATPTQRHYFTFED